MRSSLALTLIVSLASVLVVVAPAGAATVTAELAPTDGSYPSHYAVTVDGGPESDDIELTVRDRVIEVVDATAPLVAGEGCTSVDAHHAGCTLQGVTPLALLWVKGGPGDDRLRVNGTPPAHIDGDAGDDQVFGGDGDDLIRGGPGGDRLSGGSGADRFVVGDPSMEAVDALELVGDAIDGGDGRDKLSIARLRRQVTVDLGQGAIASSDGTATVAAVEDVAADRMTAVLRGDGGPNELSVFGAAATLDGRGGNDSLIGSSEADTLIGGDGDDSLAFGRGDAVDAGAGNDVITGSGSLDPLSPAGAPFACGQGQDTVEAPGGRLVPSDCERMLMARIGSVGRPVLDRLHRVPVVVAVQADACGVAVELVSRSGRPLSARRRARVRRSDQKVRLVLSLTTAARRAAVTGRLSRAVLIVRGYRSCPRRGAWGSRVAYSFSTMLTASSSSPPS